MSEQYCNNKIISFLMTSVPAQVNINYTFPKWNLTWADKKYTSIIKKNTTITHCIPTHSIMKSSHRIITVTRQQDDNYCKATHQHDCKTRRTQSVA